MSAALFLAACVLWLLPGQYIEDVIATPLEPHIYFPTKLWVEVPYINNAVPYKGTKYALSWWISISIVVGYFLLRFVPILIGNRNDLRHGLSDIQKAYGYFVLCALIVMGAVVFLDVGMITAHGRLGRTLVNTPILWFWVALSSYCLLDLSTQSLVFAWKFLRPPTK